MHHTELEYGWRTRHDGRSQIISNKRSFLTPSAYQASHVDPWEEVRPNALTYRKIPTTLVSQRIHTSRHSVIPHYPFLIKLNLFYSIIGKRKR